jgi:cytochrome c oxidase assembly protein subunit 15
MPERPAMLIQLAITGLLVALLPLAIVWVSGDADKFRKLAWVTAFLAFDLILVGGFTRLSDSGLGCPDWPGCYGHANPFQADTHIAAAEALLPGGPVTVVKAWIEMLHRYFAMAIGVLITALVVIAWRRWWRSQRSDRRFAPWYPTMLLGYVCLVGAFGALTVTQKLQPLFVTGHLILALGLFALLVWQVARLASHEAVAPAALSLRGPATVVGILLLVQIALGGWVSSNYAVLACSEFPLCQGALVPTMDFAHGFTLWRKLGMTGNGDYLPFAALTAIHWTHRLFAFVVAAAILWLAHKALRVDGLRRTARWLLLALALQFSTGILTVYLSWPLLLALAHNGGAALLVLLMTMLNYKARIPAHPVSTPASVPRMPTALKSR